MPLPTDTTLIDLRLTWSTHNRTQNIPLVPTSYSLPTTNFSTRYTTRNRYVGNRVARVTVTPTTNNSAASWEILDENFRALADADGNTHGYQVNLAVGTNKIRARVTSADRSSTLTYTLTVSRAAPSNQNCQTSPVLNELWCAMLTVQTTSGTTQLGCNNSVAGSNCSATSNLTDDAFTHDGTTYTAYSITTSGGSLNLLFSGVTDLPDDWTVHINGIGSNGLDVGDSKELSVGANRSASWTNTGLSWKVGQRVMVQITEANPVMLASLDLNLTGKVPWTFKEGVEFRWYATTELRLTA